MPTAVESRDACVSMVLEHFADTARTEEAFYLRFQTLPKAHLAALKCAWREPDDWRIFWRIWTLARPRKGRTSGKDRVSALTKPRVVLQ